MPSDRTTQESGGIPPLAWGLIGLAAAHLVVYPLLRSQIEPGAYAPQWVPDALRTVALFGLATALVLGADRWAAGRHWMRRAVVLLVAAALLQASSQWYLAWMLGDTSRIDAGLNPLLFSRALLEAGSLAAGLACFGMGLWCSRAAEAPPAGRWTTSRRVVVAIGALAFVSGAAEVAYAVAISLNTLDAVMVAAGAAWSIAATLVPLALAFVAFAALGYRPLRLHLREVAIAVGAVLILVADGWGRWAVVLTSMIDPFDPRWSWLAFDLPRILGIVGWFLLVGAVAVGWWVDRRAEPSPSSLAVDGA
ncbi:MAG: hypothetical protein K5924_04095 [Chloroflexi bacterium]|nr:hypothetical protein [Chloroflexota bacterium]